jgi:hypothetical protein
MMMIQYLEVHENVVESGAIVEKQLELGYYLTDQLVWSDLQGRMLRLWAVGPGLGLSPSRLN